MAKYDGWMLKNERGALLVAYFGYTRRHIILEQIGAKRWEAWKHQGCKIVKIKFVEVA